MADFTIIRTKIQDLVILEPQVFGDARGYFVETYNARALADKGFSPAPFVQDNESKSRRGVLRGLHFQTKHPQGKLVRAVYGEVFDVAVDLRMGSPTFGQWEGILLSGENKRMFYVPEGFAHGFMVVSEEAVFAYKCTDYYAPEYDAGIRWNDSDLGIQWPLEGVGEPQLSAKDAALPLLRDIQSPFTYKK